MTVEEIVVDLIEGRKKAPLLKALLSFLSQGYKMGVFLKNFSYDWLIPSTKLKIPVISVGNILAGGTGKTPFIVYLAKTLASKKIAVISRGYRRKIHSTVVVKKDTLVEECGDEPYLIAQNLPEATVIVDQSKVFAGLLAEKYGVDLLLLDDGMQYRALHRDVEIVLIQADNPIGNRQYLPRGLLRDSPKRLKNAHQIILSGVQSEEDFYRIKKILSFYTQSPVTAMEYHTLNGSQIVGKKIVAFCAIASPHRFKRVLESLGCEVLQFITRADHTSFTYQELEALCKLAPGADYLVCTEKDWVKIPPHWKFPIPLFCLKISLLPTYGKESLKHTLSEIEHLACKKKNLV